MKLKRLTSLLVAGCMMVSMLPASAVTAFADGGTEVSDSVQAGVTTYQELVDAIKAASAGDTITLSNDIDVEETLAVDKQLTLDLAGHTLYNEINDLWKGDNWSLISVREEGDLTITGNGTLKAKKDDCHALDVQDEGAKLTIENGTFVGNISAVYVLQGSATIKGGTFSIQQLNTNNVQDEYGLTINCRDEYHKDGTANIVVTGGTFSHFDPASNRAEGNGTNFCAPGYITTQNGDDYTVKADVDTDAEPEITQEGEAGVPVQIAITANGAKEVVESIQYVSLDFGNDLDIVKNVELTKDNKTVNLTDEGYANTAYQNIPLTVFDTDPVALLAAAPERGTLDLTLSVTYTENGAHSVKVVFGNSEQKEVSSDTATVQIGPKDSTSGDGDSVSGGADAALILAGAAVGTGVAVFAYHIGTEIFADQILGKGAPVPSTREEVALKAWELAGKPAAAPAEGEQALSETEQAERWVVANGLMETESDGSFNGQKKVGKIKALRILDAAKEINK